MLNTKEYNSDTQKLVKISFIDSILLTILLLLKLKLSQINKRVVQIRSGGNFRKLISGGDVYQAPKSTLLVDSPNCLITKSQGTKRRSMISIEVFLYTRELQTQTIYV